MATAGARANPHKMPGQQWVYTVFALIGGFLSFVAFWLAVPEVARLWALGGLPRYAGVPIAGGAIYCGVLEGPVETTALGHPAVAWIGVVTQTSRRGKGTYTAERCRIGRVHDLHLVGDGARWEISTPRLGDVELKLGFSAARDLHTRYSLSRAETVSPVPDDVIERCRIDRADLARGDWEYSEQAAPPGSSAEFAGCAAGEVLRSCGGIAAGHLSTEGIRAMVRRGADGLIQIVTVFVLLTTFFSAFGAISAVLALRAAAPNEVVQPERWT